MNLEQRVQILEEEVQLLKNQIQTTLLVIQEQILSNTYPSLRGEEAGSYQADHMPETSPLVQVVKPVEGLRGVNRVSLDTTDQVSVETPVVRAAATSAPAMTPPSYPSTPAPVPTSTPARLPSSIPPAMLGFEARQSSAESASIDWASLNKMDEWICRKIDKMGVQRTRRLIDFYAETRRFSESVTNTLLQLIALYEEDVDPEVEEVYRGQALNIDDTITNFDPPIRTYYAESDMPRQNDERDVMVRRESELELDFNGNGNGNTPTDPEHPDAPRKMILKLIAGLQNAGMDWKKPNG